MKNHHNPEDKKNESDKLRPKKNDVAINPKRKLQKCHTHARVTVKKVEVKEEKTNVTPTKKIDNTEILSGDDSDHQSSSSSCSSDCDHSHDEDKIS